ncbi:uracil-DNA glycosylase [Vibrio sp. D431a]|uniref:uracil-DNA glycosylase n=1 Tax=Vibrio sp. D431a TaxID=2837388 RepID=UPI00255606D8|nr:uracil-DNA glycosylase [Vibrio sp. D431a]MDK9790638.1 uracil-DNA glycosylase [Vibrio sp. D431a]
MLLDEFRKIHPSWYSILQDQQELLKSIESKVQKQSQGKLILPEPQNIFRALKDSNFDDLCAVVVGQDPYHQTPELPDGSVTPQAMGLAFSVPEGIKPPPSLKNIYKELSSSFIDFRPPTHGDLSKWTDRVLLLNTALTVEHSNAGAHSKTGWSDFTSAVIEKLIQREKPLVFLAWGKHAHKVVSKAEGTQHLVIKTSHPSPLGATKSGNDFVSFIGSQCFKTTNDFLSANGLKEIDWTL